MLVLTRLRFSGLDAAVHGPTTFDDMMADDDNVLLGVLELTLYGR